MKKKVEKPGQAVKMDFEPLMKQIIFDEQSEERISALFKSVRPSINHVLLTLEHCKVPGRLIKMSEDLIFVYFVGKDGRTVKMENPLLAHPDMKPFISYLAEGKLYRFKRYEELKKDILENIAADFGTLKARFNFDSYTEDEKNVFLLDLEEVVKENHYFKLYNGDFCFKLDVLDDNTLMAASLEQGKALGYRDFTLKIGEERREEDESQNEDNEIPKENTKLQKVWSDLTENFSNEEGEFEKVIDGLMEEVPELEEFKDDFVSLADALRSFRGKKVFGESEPLIETAEDVRDLTIEFLGAEKERIVDFLSKLEPNRRMIVGPALDSLADLIVSAEIKRLEK